VDKDTEHGLSPLLDAAVQAHELFLSFIEAGFTEEQAIKLVIGLLKSGTE
jgi:hypothetical protein